MNPNQTYERLRYPDAPAVMERLAAFLHGVYQQEVRRQMPRALLKYPDDYGSLQESVKDFDRALAIFILEEIAAPNQVLEALDELERDALNEV